jgi:hypothetical protein
MVDAVRAAREKRRKSSSRRSTNDSTGSASDSDDVFSTSGRARWWTPSGRRTSPPSRRRPARPGLGGAVDGEDHGEIVAVGERARHDLAVNLVVVDPPLILPAHGLDPLHDILWRNWERNQRVVFRVGGVLDGRTCTSIVQHGIDEEDVPVKLNPKRSVANQTKTHAQSYRQAAPRQRNAHNPRGLYGRFSVFPLCPLW